MVHKEAIKVEQMWIKEWIHSVLCLTKPRPQLPSLSLQTPRLVRSYFDRRETSTMGGFSKCISNKFGLEIWGIQLLRVSWASLTFSLILHPPINAQRLKSYCLSYEVLSFSWRLLVKYIYIYRKTPAPITGVQREFPLLNTTISVHSSIFRHVASFLMKKAAEQTVSGQF